MRKYYMQKKCINDEKLRTCTKVFNHKIQSTLGFSFFFKLNPGIKKHQSLYKISKNYHTKWISFGMKKECDELVKVNCQKTETSYNVDV